MRVSALLFRSSRRPVCSPLPLCTNARFAWCEACVRLWNVARLIRAGRESNHAYRMLFARFARLSERTTKQGAARACVAPGGSSAVPHAAKAEHLPTCLRKARQRLIPVAQACTQSAACWVPACGVMHGLPRVQLGSGCFAAARSRHRNKPQPISPLIRRADFIRFTARIQ